ncbi:hypothetical protein BSKO_10288 [Bryopsis sp. KO-2023]|nr:hypothetical protein BSKO_10288 [Bryopsis sp. KO-2023]
MSSNAQTQSNAATERAGPDGALQSSTRGPLSNLQEDIISLVPSTTDCLVLDDETGDKENVNPDGGDYGLAHETIGLENLQLRDTPCLPFQEISNPTIDQPRSRS